MKKQSFSFKSSNYIQTEQPENWEDETIRREVTEGMSLLNAVVGTIYSTNPQASIDCDIDEMTEFFMDCRDYGVFGNAASMRLYDSPGMEKAIPFLLAATPLASLDGQFLFSQPRNPLRTLAACINSVFARCKLEIDYEDGGSVPAYFEWGVFENNIVGLQLGQEINDSLTVYELSLLAGMSEQGVRNALHEKSAPKTRKRGPYGLVTVAPKDALSWLETRAGFKAESTTPAEGSIRVPVDKRGYFFNSKCKQGAGFKVGEKGAEKYYPSFGEALEALAGMETPRFRRPNTNNRYGIVTGIRWAYKSKEELGLV